MFKDDRPSTKSKYKKKSKDYYQNMNEKSTPKRSKTFTDTNQRDKNYRERKRSQDIMKDEFIDLSLREEKRKSKSK